MCIYAKKGSRKTATEDIHVWKVIATTPELKNSWTGPFFNNNHFPFDEEIKQKPVDERAMITSGCFVESPMMKVGEGFFFSVRDKIHADDIRFSIAVDAGEEGYFVHVAEAIIPKGSFYYTYDTPYGCRTYASSSIIVKKPKELE